MQANEKVERVKARPYNEIKNWMNDSKSISYEDKIRFTKKNAERIKQEIKKFSKNELLILEDELNDWKWDESRLGKYKGALEASAYRLVIKQELGEYEVLKHWAMQDGEREEEFHVRMLKELVDDIYREPILKEIFY